MTDLTDEQLEEIKARAEAATPGPWRQEGPRVYFGYEGGISLHAAPNPINNSHFIAHARTDIPALLSALEAAEKEVKDARREGLRLATALHRRWYRDISPSWEPLEHAPGLLSQIDNMTAGLGQRLEAANKRADEAEALVETLKREAQLHAQEARTANATIAEIYQAVTGGTGEPGNWHGAEPIKAELTRLRGEIEQYREAAKGQVVVVNTASSRIKALEAALKLAAEMLTKASLCYAERIDEALSVIRRALKENSHE